MMRAEKKLLVIAGILVVGLGIFGWSIFASSPETTYTDGPSTSSDVLGAQTRQSEGTQPTNPTVQQPATTQPKTSPITSQQPTTQQSAPPLNDADKTTMENAQKALAAQQEQARQAQCTALQSKHDADVSSENGRHTNALSAIDTNYLSRGLGYSGAYQAAKDQENAKNQANLQAIESQSASDSASYGC